MSLISTWSTVANANGTLGSPPFYWPEGQAPSTVNDCARLMMATIRTQWNDASWFNWGYTVTKVSGTSFTVVTASANTVTLPAAFEVSGRIKCLSTATIYGTITTVSVSAASTQVTFTPDSGSLGASFSSVFNSILSPTNTAIPGLSIPTDVITQTTQQIYANDTGVTNSAQITLSPVLASYVSGQMLNFKAVTDNTGSMTLQVDALGVKTIKKYGGSSNLEAGDVKTGQIVTVVYDGTNWEMQSQGGNSFISQTTAQIYAADAGVSDAYAISLSPAISSYAVGQMLSFKANTSNTGACTLNVNGLGAKSIKKQYNLDPSDSDINAGQVVTVVYDGTNFQMQSIPGSAGGGIVGASGSWALLSSASGGGVTYEFAALFTSSYDLYAIEFLNVLPATDGATFQAQIGTGAGPTYVTANYQWINKDNYNNTSEDCFGNSSDSKFIIDQANGGTVGVSNTAANGGVSGVLFLNGFNGASTIAGGEWVTRSVGNASGLHRNQGAFYQAAANYTAIKFFFSSGNITSGTVRLYGVKNT